MFHSSHEHKLGLFAALTFAAAVLALVTAVFSPTVLLFGG